MFKIVLLSLVSAASFAQDKSWQELILAEEYAKPLTTMLLNEEFHADLAKQRIYSGVPEGAKEDAYIKFFYKSSLPYEKKAVDAAEGKQSIKEVFESAEYQDYRKFLIYGQRNPRLRDLMFEIFARKHGTSSLIAVAVALDNHPEIRAGFARTFARSQQRLIKPEDQFKNIQIFAKFIDKKDLSQALKDLEQGPAVAGVDPCNPQFWILARSVGGTQKYPAIEADIKENLDSLDAVVAQKRFSPAAAQAQKNRCTTAYAIRDLSDENLQKLKSDKAYQDEFWKKNLAYLSGKEQADHRKWLQESLNFFMDPGTQFGATKAQLLQK